MEMVYETINHGLTERTVEPYFIVFRGHAFYFVAYCRLRGDFRTFRIDRVQQLVTLSEKFRIRRGVNAGDYFDDSWRLYSGEVVEIAIRFCGASAKVVKSGQYHPRETIELADDGTVVYRVSVSGTDEIQRWILGFGAEAEVLSPASLRAELGRTGRLLAKLYSR